MRILVTGGNGTLGTSLKKKFKGAFFPSRKEADVTKPKEVENLIAKYKPEILIHTAALVDVRKCQQDKELAWKTNVEGTQNIVNALKKHAKKCYLVYISTACVFAGENGKFYTEYDLPVPKNYYSLTKLCGEIVTRQHENTLIIRTNFAPKGQWKYPKAFVDRFGTYLFSDDVARGIFEAIKEKKKGIIHIVGDKRMSMYGLALLANSKNVGKLTLDEYDGPPLTIDMSLSTKRWKRYRIGG